MTRTIDCKEKTMSYDLIVFDPEAPPSDRDGFLKWYKQQTQWSESHDYNDPDVSTPALRSWFFEITKLFPPMNGPYASDDCDDSRVSDYCIGRSIIYITFAWSQADEAFRATFSLGQKHKVGFVDVSSDAGQVWVPDANGDYTCVHGGK